MEYIPYRLNHTSTFTDHGEFQKDFYTELNIPRTVTTVNVRFNGVDYEGLRISTASGRIHFKDRRQQFLANNPGLQVGENMNIEVGWQKPTEGTGRQAIHFWAGGFNSNHGRLRDFIDNQFWQALDYNETDQSRAAKKARIIFSKISVGDKFLIKGFGGRSDLIVHYVGTVVRKDEKLYRLDLERIDVPLYKDKAPAGPGAGNWFDTLLEVTRPDDIAKLFGTSPEIVPSNKNNSENQYSMKSLNTIFYGPPGTGKTYRMQQLIKENGLLVMGSAAQKDYDTFVRGYHWWELVAMAFLELQDHKAKVPELMKHPLIRAKFAQSDIQNLRARLWSTLQHHTVESCPNVKLKKRHGELIFYKEPDSTWRLDNIGTFKTNYDLFVEDLTEFNATGSAREQKNYLFTTCHQSLSYEDFIEGIKPKLSIDEINTEEEEGDVKYELRKGYFYFACNKAAQLAGYTNLNDCLEATKDDRKQKFAAAISSNKVFYLFLDEINRCNVAAVFGELITLIEDNKRLGGADEICDTILPYSQKPFGVPANLYIVGTMNTADRSVEALDAALRRRFSFEEMKPKPSLLSPQSALWRLWWDYSHVGWQNPEYLEKEKRLVAFLGVPPTQNDEDFKEKIWAPMKKEGKNENQIAQFNSWIFNGFNLQKLLEKLNERIAYLKDRDHQIGHSYFLNVDSFDRLKVVFRDAIIPLLKEYFYNDYEKILWILGEGFVKVQDAPPKFAARAGEDLGKQTYIFVELNSKFDIESALKLAVNE